MIDFGTQLYTQLLVDAGLDMTVHDPTTVVVNYVPGMGETTPLGTVTVRVTRTVDIPLQDLYDAINQHVSATLPTPELIPDTATPDITSASVNRLPNLSAPTADTVIAPPITPITEPIV